jgi:hypothetical protein
MATVDTYPTLSDGLTAIIRSIEPTRTTGLVMTRRNVATFLDGLQALLEEARRLEAIDDRVRWNERARSDRQHSRRKELEAGIAAGTVQLLPVVPRAEAVRQGDDGGAA